MSFSVLSDVAVKGLLANLRKQDLISIQHALKQAFVAYSLNNEGAYQPHRASVTRPDGQTTLFMPATSPSSVGAKIIGVPPPTATGKTLAGVLVLCDSEGKAKGILNAGEVTAFRTALGSMSLLEHRRKLSNVVVFGAGKQAFWHIRLAQLLRGADIARITVVNRSADRSNELLQRLKEEESDAKAETNAFDSTRPDYDEALEQLVQSADAIFCTTPAKVPLFPATYLASAVGRGTGPYITAIGSYKIEMSELDPVLFRDVVDAKTGYHPKGKGGGVIVVDSREGCFQESGEIVQGKIEAEQIVEVGEVLDILEHPQGNDDKSLDDWLANGLVIYKSVGIGIMDLAVGNALLDLAKEKNVGSSLPAL
ncbi:shikimate/quinate 5-dehydrogenase [Dendryphion nanum]|uniref:Shikimate/quinate 5-dehydrogenase n=1 Tax=Dendryphion nanum TaxID=256645 RepID=A0A9P9IVD9_9PLEO|nr:shikimate/quinate 5-dehydrogenase [Dendryphion nanum]